MKKRKDYSIKKRIVICLGILFLFFVTLYLSFLSQEDMADKSSLKPVTPEKAAIQKNRVAFIIDDIGYNLSPVHRIVRMNTPVTLSILPHCPHSKEAAHEAKLNGLEVILHLPMEPYEYPEKNPGEGALLTRMNKVEIINILKEDIESVPGILGVNNHMGSRFMESEEKLTIVFSELKKKNLFFVDSYTTNNSMGRRVAKKVGIVYASRDVFIDNNGIYKDTIEILKNLINTRNRWETLILIGHPYANTLKAMNEIRPLFKSEEINVVPLSTLVK